MDTTKLYQIVLTLLPRVGSVIAKSLVAYCGSPEEVFREKRSRLKLIPGVGDSFADAFGKTDKAALLARAEAERDFIEKNKVSQLFFTDDAYPKRLKECNDGPVLLFYKGTADLNSKKILAVIGTRNATEYGRLMTDKILSGLKDDGVLVLSGLAYGIDITAHRAALKTGLETIGVLGHGLDQIYPQMHEATAAQMLKQGGLLTEYLTRTKPDRENFPTRNRIVAGMCDGVLVIESGVRGGSLITTEIALSYNRDVLAVPGKTGEMYSAGCNKLIKTYKAALVENADDVKYHMGWAEEKKTEKRRQHTLLFAELCEEEKSIISVLETQGKLDIDSLAIQCGMPIARVSSLLLGLEFKSVVKVLPGKLVELI